MDEQERMELQPKYSKFQIYSPTSLFCGVDRRQMLRPYHFCLKQTSLVMLLIFTLDKSAKWQNVKKILLGCQKWHPHLQSSHSHFLSSTDIKHKSTEHNSCLMMSESELDSEQENIFNYARSDKARNRANGAVRNGDAFSLCPVEGWVPGEHFFQGGIFQWMKFYKNWPTIDWWSYEFLLVYWRMHFDFDFKWHCQFEFRSCALNSHCSLICT